EMYFAKWRPVARANEIRPPLRSVTTIDITFFPTVACHSELNMNASYSQGPKNVTTIPAPIVPAVTTPLAAPTIMKSMMKARKRTQNPAYVPVTGAAATADTFVDSGAPQTWQYVALSSFCFPQLGQNI